MNRIDYILCIDIIINITSYLNNKDKINFLSVNSKYHKLKNKIVYCNPTHINKLITFTYHARFNGIMVNFLKNKAVYPKNYDQFHNIITNTLDIKLPSNLTHLTFDDNFNQEILEVIPGNKITHLIFGYNFNKHIFGIIPKSVTHLTFGRYFNKTIIGAIPDSVVEITCHRYFSRKIKNIISNKIHLKIYD